MAQRDLVIRGGTVVDGTGVPRYQADVGPVHFLSCRVRDRQLVRSSRPTTR